MHTPTPWQADASGGYNVLIFGDIHDDKYGNHVQTLIAKVMGNRTSGAVTQADARLIVAAPDLLAACKLRIEDHQCAISCDGPHESCPCWYCVCCMAIANAEGK